MTSRKNRRGAYGLKWLPSEYKSLTQDTDSNLCPTEHSSYQHARIYKKQKNHHNSSNASEGESSEQLIEEAQANVIQTGETYMYGTINIDSTLLNRLETPVLINEEEENLESNSCELSEHTVDDGSEPIWFDALQDPSEEHVTLTMDTEPDTMNTDSQPVQGDQPTVDTEECAPDLLKQPLFADSRLNLGCALLLLTLFLQKYNLTTDAASHLLALLHLFLPEHNILWKNYSLLRKFFRNMKNNYIRHYYCSKCLKYLGFVYADIPRKCPNKDCKSDLQREGAFEYFIEIPVKDQLKNLFSTPGFFNSLQGRFTRSVGEDICDIYDGRVYKDMFQNNGPLSNPANISFTMNTDGAPIFKSNSVSMWPIYLAVNELPFKKRTARDNMIFAGMWLSAKKPSMSTYLKPFQATFNELSMGIPVSSPDREDNNFMCKAFLLAVTTDLPARCMVCNGMQYNGAYSCWKCEQAGESATSGKGRCHIFPYVAPSDRNVNSPLRTKQTVYEHAKEVVQRQNNGEKISHVKGVKGPSWLMRFPHFDIVRGVGIDIMHGVFLGVMKLMLRLWFDPKFKNEIHNGEKFSYYTFHDTVNGRLAKLKPNLNITRLPVDVTVLKHWKASVYRSFLLFFAAPVLKGVLSPARFAHILCLINAMHILLRDRITPQDLENAQMCLERFVRTFTNFYPARFMTLNVHQLLHLTDEVRNLGPLYSVNTFHFEDKNGYVLKMIRGVRHIDSQVVTSLSLVQKLPELRHNEIKQGTPEFELCEELCSKSTVKKGCEILPNCFVLGGSKYEKLSTSTISAITLLFGTSLLPMKAVTFSRIQKNGELLYGTRYSRQNKRNNSVIKYKSMSGCAFATIEYFIHVENHNLAIIKPFITDMSKPSYMYKTKLTSGIHAIYIKDILSLCILTEVTDDKGENHLYVCEEPNKLETL